MTDPINTATLHLCAPSHAVEPALLAQRLPRLAAALAVFAAAPAANMTARPTPPHSGMVQVHAALLGVQRDHITLERLPALDAPSRARLQALAASLANEAGGEGKGDAEPLVFTPHSHGLALGELNVYATLPPAANFIGRDIATALPRSADAKRLRQFVNAAQMALHQDPHGSTAGVVGTVGTSFSPISSPINSLWCSNPVPTDDLSQTWLQGGLAAWWDALPAWDAVLDLSALGAAAQLQLVFSDQCLTVPMVRRRAWAFWQHRFDLQHVLESALV